MAIGILFWKRLLLDNFEIHPCIHLGTIDSQNSPDSIDGFSFFSYDSTHILGVYFEREERTELIFPLLNNYIRLMRNERIYDKRKEIFWCHKKFMRRYEAKLFWSDNGELFLRSFENFYESLGILSTICYVRSCVFFIELKFLSNRIVESKNLNIPVLRRLFMFSKNDMKKWNMFSSRARKSNLKHRLWLLMNSYCKIECNYWCPGWELNPYSHEEQDFKSCVSTIPPPGQKRWKEDSLRHPPNPYKIPFFLSVLMAVAESRTRKVTPVEGSFTFLQKRFG